MVKTPVEEQQKSTTCLPINMLPEASRKPRMKVKAAKIIKHLLNFLQIKPKRKQEEHEKLSTPNILQNCFCENVHEFSPLLASKPLEVAPREKTDNGLSLSWSYLVHDQTNISACHFKEVPHAGDIIENGGIFYNESYFEDDYWQDFRGQNDFSAGSPVCDIFSQRIFEPEKTPYGEFKRSSARPDASSRRHNSLPNINVENIHDANISEMKDLDDDIFDIENLAFNDPQMGLKIAFDSLLDEACMYESQIFSSNKLPLLAEDSPYYGHYSECTHTNYVIKYLDNISFETSVWNSDTSSSSSPPDCLKQLNFSISPKRSENTEGLSDSATDDSLNEDMVLLDRKYRKGLSMMDLSLSQTAAVGKLNYQADSNISKESKHQRPESGYNSTGSSSPTSPVNIPDPLTISDLSALKWTKSKAKTITEAVLDKENSSSVNDKEAVRLKHLPSKLSVKELPRQTILTITNPPTSSPMLIANSPSLTSHKILTPGFCCLSPIEQNPQSAKTTGNTKTTESKSKNIEKQRHVLDISSLPDKLLFLRTQNPILGKDKMKSPEPLSEPYLTKAAEFIVSRIQFKDELKSDINMSELVEFLNAHFTEEIAILDNRNIRSISDYHEFIQKASIFTIGKLTQETCFSELLKGILGNHSIVVSMCGEFLCNNPHIFISQDFLHAPPELIVMLLSYHRTSVNSPEIKLENYESKLDVKKAMSSYLEAHQTVNFDKYCRIKRMITYTIYRKSAFSLKRKLACNQLVSLNSASQRRLQDTEFQSYDQFVATPVKLGMSVSSNSKQEHQSLTSDMTKKSCNEVQINHFQVSYRLPRSVSEIATLFNRLDQKVPPKAPACRSNLFLGTSDSSESNYPDVPHVTVKTADLVFQEQADCIQDCRHQDCRHSQTCSLEAFSCTKKTEFCLKDKLSGADSEAREVECLETDTGIDVVTGCTSVLSAKKQGKLFRAKTFSSVHNKSRLSFTGETLSMKVEHQSYKTLRRWNAMDSVLSTEV